MRISDWSSDVCSSDLTSVWGFDNLNLGDPWGIDTVEVADLNLAVADLWTIVLAGLAMAAFFAFFRYTATGVAMRATAIDQEAAVAPGLGAGRIFALAWGVPGAVAEIGRASCWARVGPCVTILGGA